MQEIRIGMIGAGNWAIGRARSFNEVEGCRVVTGWSRSEDARDRFERELAAPTVTDWRAVCDTDAVDAVIISTPHVFHFDQAHAALHAGKHIFVETPLCLEYSQALALVETADARDLVIHHGAKWRYHPDHAQEIEHLRSVGALVHAVQTGAWDPGPERAWYADSSLSGGSFALLPYMAVDIFSAYGDVAQVEGKHIRREGIDVATMWVQCAAGGQATITYATGAGVADFQTGAVIGTQATLLWEADGPKRLIRSGEAIELPPRRDLDIVLAENEAFTAEVRGTRDFRPDLLLDLRILQAVTAARTSAHTSLTAR